MIAAYVLPAFLGVGLAASCGLRTFLPLLMLALAAHFHAFGVSLNPALAWLASPAALIALGLAAAVELVADKIPLVDHLLALVGTVTRPIAGVIAASAALSHMDPTTAAVAGLILGAPTALAVHSAQTATRAVSTATTAGLANPFLSIFEEFLAAGNAILAMVAPIVVPVVLLLALGGGLWFFRRRRPRAAPSSIGQTQ